LGGSGLDIEDNITALEESIFNINIAPVELLRPDFPKKSTKGKCKPEKYLGKWKQDDLGPNESMTTEEMILKANSDFNAFNSRLGSINKQFQDYDNMITSAKLIQLNLADLNDKKASTRRLNQINNQGSRSVSI
jgi:hypothetical protein